MLAKAAQSQAERQAEKESDEGAGMKNHPVMRTMYDHDSVSACVFRTILYVFRFESVVYSYEDMKK